MRCVVRVNRTTYNSYHNHFIHLQKQVRKTTQLLLQSISKINSR